MSLTEFLLARIAEDEEIARRSAPDDLVPGEVLEYELRDEQQFETLCIPARRVLAECEAKRQAIEWASSEGLHNPNSEYSRGWMTAGYFILRSLALPYADHHDYDPTWRP